jgi:hypothetical protein
VGHFDNGHARINAELASFVGTALRMQRSKGRLNAASEAQGSLKRDMDQKLKNLRPRRPK